MENRVLLGLQRAETVRQAAGESLRKFVLISIIAGLPAFLEAFDSEIYSFGSTYIVPSLTGPPFLTIADSDWICGGHCCLQPCGRLRL
ncbi:hypothetical protein [Thermogymnomonas acidicola]|uniref:hypothetical protein n=1 Tax=Thermogymnomonas acidicola TaxID=399579 RepID=UPI001396773E|nr:hypothetical protein [Thermogymnomonas acidicola]